MMYALLFVAIFATSTAIDYAGVQHILAVDAGERHRASRWTVAQWAAGLLGFIVALKVTLWLLPAEALGLYVGTYYSVEPRAERRG